MHACGGMRARAPIPQSSFLRIGELLEHVHAVVNGGSHVVIVVDRALLEHARPDARGAARLLDPRVVESGPDG